MMSCKMLPMSGVDCATWATVDGAGASVVVVGEDEAALASPAGALDALDGAFVPGAGDGAGAFCATVAGDGAAGEPLPKPWPPKFGAALVLAEVAVELPEPRVVFVGPNWLLVSVPMLPRAV
jgi:hypothetical protein